MVVICLCTSLQFFGYGWFLITFVDICDVIQTVNAISWNLPRRRVLDLPAPLETEWRIIMKMIFSLNHASALLLPT